MAIINRWILLALCMMLVAGCAKRVTSKASRGSEITIQLQLDAAPTFDTVDYYLIYGNGSFRLNNNIESNYFFIPGTNYNVSAVDQISNGDGLSHFYTTYFKTWAGALRLKANDVSLTKGPFAGDTRTDDAHYTYTSRLIPIDDYRVNGQTISFTLPVSTLGLTGNILYFSFVTVKGNTINNTQDLVSTIQSIEIISNRPPLTGENSTSLFSPSAGAKVVSWAISVQ